MISSELNANRRRVGELDSESTGTIVGNIALGVVGVAIFPPLLFAMDLRNAAATERDSLAQRNNFLTSMQAERCGAPQSTAVVVASAPVIVAPAPVVPMPAPPVGDVAVPVTPQPILASAPIPVPASSIAVAALQPAIPVRQSLQHYVEAARADCQRQRRRNCEAAAEAAAVEYDNAWQAQSAGRGRMR